MAIEKINLHVNLSILRSIRNWIAFGVSAMVILLLLDWLNEMGAFANFTWRWF